MLKLFHYFEIFALVVSIVCFKKIRNTILVLSIPYLTMIVTYEIGTKLGWFTTGKTNHRIANFEMLFEFSFYILLLVFVFLSNKIKRAIYISEIIFVLVFLLNMIFEQLSNRYNSYTYIF